MKHVILIIAVVSAFIVNTAPAHAGWFNNDKQHQRQIEKLETQLQQQQKTSATWQVIAFVLGIGCVTALVVGAAIGSKGRQNVR